MVNTKKATLFRFGYLSKEVRYWNLFPANECIKLIGKVWRTAQRRFHHSACGQSSLNDTVRWSLTEPNRSLGSYRPGYDWEYCVLKDASAVLTVTCAFSLVTTKRGKEGRWLTLVNVQIPAYPWPPELTNAAEYAVKKWMIATNIKERENLSIIRKKIFEICGMKRQWDWFDDLKPWMQNVTMSGGNIPGNWHVSLSNLFTGIFHDSASNAQHDISCQHTVKSISMSVSICVI